MTIQVHSKLVYKTLYLQFIKLKYRIHTSLTMNLWYCVIYCFGILSTSYIDINSKVGIILSPFIYF